VSVRVDPTLPRTALRRWRESERGYPYAELARRIDRHVRTVMFIAAGGACTPETARLIRRETGISLDELIGDALPPRTRPLERDGTRVLDTAANRVVALSRPGNDVRAGRAGGGAR
jgi:hypothetical protein